jgi:hypothetical protein
MQTIRKLPIRTRLPPMAWAFAGIVTLFSLVASIVHTNVTPDRSVPVVARDAHRASLTDILEIFRVF